MPTICFGKWQKVAKLFMMTFASCPICYSNYYDDFVSCPTCYFFHGWIFLYRWDNLGLCVLFYFLFILDGLNFVVDETTKVFVHCYTCYLFHGWLELVSLDETTKVFAYCSTCYLFHGWREFCSLDETTWVFAYCSTCHLFHGWRKFGLWMGQQRSLRIVLLVIYFMDGMNFVL